MRLTLIITTILFITVSYAQKDTVRTYHTNGNLKTEIPYLNGVREGTAIFYGENGNIAEERNYINDKVSGLIKLFYPTGNLRELFNIEYGKREGPTSIFDSSGVYVEDIFFENGIRTGQEYVLIGEVREEDLEKIREQRMQEYLRKKGKLNTDLSAPPPEVEKDVEDDPAFYLTVEVMPEPIGGMNSIYKRLSYPKDLKEKKIEGTVLVKVFIESDGEVSSADVIESLHPVLDESARLAVYYTRFKPGLQRGKRVKVQMNIPIEFSAK